MMKNKILVFIFLLSTIFTLQILSPKNAHAKTADELKYDCKSTVPRPPVHDNLAQNLADVCNQYDDSHLTWSWGAVWISHEDDKYNSRSTIDLYGNETGARLYLYGAAFINNDDYVGREIWGKITDYVCKVDGVVKSCDFLQYTQPGGAGNKKDVTDWDALWLPRGKTDTNYTWTKAGTEHVIGNATYLYLNMNKLKDKVGGSFSKDSYEIAVTAKRYFCVNGYGNECETATDTGTSIINIHIKAPESVTFNGKCDETHSNPNITPVEGDSSAEQPKRVTVSYNYWLEQTPSSSPDFRNKSAVKIYNKKDEEEIELGFNPDGTGESKQVCGRANYRPLTATYLPPDSDFTVTDNREQNIECCSTITRTNRKTTENANIQIDYGIDHSVVEPTGTAYTTNPDGNVYSYSKETRGATVKFDHFIKRTSVSPSEAEAEKRLTSSQQNDYYNESVEKAITSTTYSLSGFTNGSFVPLAPGESKTICETIKYHPFSSFNYTITRVDGVETSYTTPTGDFDSGSNESTQCVTIYRETDFYEYDNSNYGVKTNLNANTYWGTPKTYAKAQATTSNPTTSDETGDLYADSETRNINLEFKYTNYYHFYSDPSGTQTSLDKIRSLTVNWWKYSSHKNNENPSYGLPETYSFNPDSNNGSDIRPSPTTTEDISVSNDNSANHSGIASSDENQITLGTYNKTICKKAETVGQATIYYDTTEINKTNSSGILDATACAHLYRPWNYNLVFDTVIAQGASTARLVDEGTAQIEVIIRNKANDAAGQEGKPSYSPDNTTISLYRKIVTGKGEMVYLNNILEGCNKYGSPLDGCLTYDEEVTDVTDGTPTDAIHYDAGSGSDSDTNTNKVKFTDTYENTKWEDIGKHVCYYAKVNYSNSVKDTDGSSYGGRRGYGSVAENPIFSHLTCFTIVGVPHAEVWGGSVYSEGDIHTKIYEQSGTLIGGVHSVSSGSYTIGSWSDYGVVGKRDIKGLASGKTIFGRFETDEYDCQNHPLTINNIVNNNSCDESTGKAAEEKLANLGQNTNITTKTKTKLLGRYRKDGDDMPSGVSPSTGNPLDDYPYTCFKNYTYQEKDKCDDTNHLFRYSKKDGNITLDGYILDSGATHVIYAAKDGAGTGGNITINGNLRYGASTYSAINQIPQYIIIADGDININENVTEINAWLIAGGEINTCDDAIDLHDGSHDKNTCNKQLEINGPIFANKINLDRTTYRMVDDLSSYGTDTMDFAAEKMDLSAFSYYWAYSQAKQTGKTTTVYQRTLPPRY